MGPRPHLSFSEWKNSVNSIRITSLYRFPALICGFWMQNRDFWTRLTSLYWVSDIDQLFCACKTAWYSTRIKRLLLFPALNCGFVHAKQRALASELLVSICSSPQLWFCECKTATDWHPNEQFSIGPRHHLWFLCTQYSVTLSTRLYLSLWVPSLMWWISAHITEYFGARITTLYGSQHPSCRFVNVKTAWL